MSVETFNAVHETGSFTYCDRAGRPMTMEEWAKAFDDLDYKRLARTVLPDGKVVSTIWLGLNHRWGDGPPLIFESMVFASDEGESLDMTRYSTEEEAKAGHEAMVAKWSKAP